MDNLVIALIAHDGKKPKMGAFTHRNKRKLSRNQLTARSPTGRISRLVAAFDAWLHQHIEALRDRRWRAYSGKRSPGWLVGSMAGILVASLAVRQRLAVCLSV